MRPLVVTLFLIFLLSCKEDHFECLESDEEEIVCLINPVISPQFPAGIKAMTEFIGKNIQHPAGCAEGKVFVQFVVEKDGSLTDLKVVKGIGAGCDEEALRVMKLVPKFLPGKQGDVRVRVQMVVPINFILH
ncbi:MAG: energy transducer TonB [Ekhidna sp.]